MNPNVLFSSSPIFKKPLFLAFILTLILIPALFYLYRTYSPKAPVQQSTQVPSEPTIKESESPVAFDILKNPLVYEWRGSVTGKLTAKDDKSITLSDDNGNSIVIPITPSSEKVVGTQFYKRGTNKTQYGTISYMDIPIGTLLRGDFFVAKNEKNRIIGSSFTVVDIVK